MSSLHSSDRDMDFDHYEAPPATEPAGRVNIKSIADSVIRFSLFGVEGALGTRLDVWRRVDDHSRPCAS